MGRHRINEEDKTVSFMTTIEGYVLDNINEDPNAYEMIKEFIKTNWGTKDELKYQKMRLLSSIDVFTRKLDGSMSKLEILKEKYGSSSELYKMMSPAVINNIAKYEEGLAKNIEQLNKLK